jgi:hypothetical protein
VGGASIFRKVVAKGGQYHQPLLVRGKVGVIGGLFRPFKHFKAVPLKGKLMGNVLGAKGTPLATPFGEPCFKRPLLAKGE